MRLFFIPISTRRALVYSHSLGEDRSAKLSLIDRITAKAAKTWTQWEKVDRGWRRQVVSFGNKAQQRIPYEEWSLKSIPSFHTQQQLDKSHGTKKVDVLFPGNAVKAENLLQMLRTIATERQGLHRNRMWWSIAAIPITIPIVLIPLVPNIPFFYFVYRGWSHWRALNGAKHLELLVNKGLINPVSHRVLERLYTNHLPGQFNSIRPVRPTSRTAEHVGKSEDRLLLQVPDAKRLSVILEAPELVLVAERAIKQIKEKLQA